MLSKQIIIGSLVLALVPTLNGCDSIKKSVNEFNTYSLADDLTLGRQTAAQIASKPTEFPVLPEAQYPQAYAYLNQIKDNILGSGKVRTARVFPYELKIIKDDKTLNAFCTPGGYIYVYTGLIKFLDSEDQLAGVLGHEIGHADKRHSTRQLTKMMPLDMIAQVLTGTDKGPVTKETQQVIAQVAGTLIGLKFSRDHETEADQASVDYLCGTQYHADGAAAFFQKIQGKGGTPPEFMSTHPDPKNRVAEIKKRKQQLNCSGNASNDTEYARIKKTLP